MGYRFFEAFPTLNLPEDVKQLIEDSKVEKVTRTSTNTLARVFITSNNIIPKETIYTVEDALKKQIFRVKNMDVRVVDRYNLSSQYTPQYIMEVYEDSIRFELEKYWKLEYNLYKTAKWVFDNENKFVLTLEDSFLSHACASSLKEYFSKVFSNRFGFNVEVEFQYYENGERKYVEENAELLERQVREIEEKLQIAKQTQEEERKKASEANAKRSAYEAKQKEFERRRPSNNDVLFGRDFDDEPTLLSNVQTEMGEIVVEGQVMSYEEKEIRNEKTILIFSITDYTDSINVKMFCKNDNLDMLRGILKKGSFVKIKGVTVYDKYDGELTIMSVNGIRKGSDKRVVRADNSIAKRVELHCHTKMSDMDGVSSAGDIIKQAIKFGHKGLAITDHGVVQGFTDAFHTLRDIEGKYKKDGKELDFKLIYGVEAYLVDDLKTIVTDSKNQSLDSTFVVFDIETTGFYWQHDKIIEIGAVKVENGKIVDYFSTFINPEVPIPFKIEKLTSINDSMVMDAPLIDEALPKFLEFVGDAVLVAHNADFDTSFIKGKAMDMGISVDNSIVDTLGLSRFLIPELNNFKLDTLCKHLGVVLQSHHRAVDDAGATAEIFVKLIEMLKERDLFTLDDIDNAGGMSDETIRKLPSRHAIILATTDVGRVNMYRMISASHLQYYNRQPKIPKSLYLKHKEGLLIGSACEAGELYQAILNERSDAEIARIVEFYDYLEIQPLGNNAFMIEKDDCYVSNNDDLIEINKKIIKLGEQFNKPVVATCDVHFLNPEDEVYRRIIMAGKGFDDADKQAPLYLRTTEEMLAEFDYLGYEKAVEVVITNPNKILEMCDKIEPVRPDKCPPVIENSDQMLRDICYNRAHELYGPDLPEVVSERLERELNSIISNGYSVMYIIAQKLVWKSNDDGYLVGSRGSVGSSFAATMAGITEVNPLSPHYLCPECYYVDFDSDEVRAFSGGAGCDMPDKICPKCGHQLNKEGFDIPFETFLGFKGNKEPDIDLNFSGEYQSKAHAYTEVIFGKGQTFKAGTVGTVADNTAFGFVKKYYEERGITKRASEMTRLASGFVGVRRTTGQHPGGIIVLPFGEEIHSFTPVQHPANDVTSNIVTTHFDYHSIDHNLLKLDILGHDDPTMIRMLQDLTGVDPKTIPLDSPEVMSLFKDTSALKISPSDIGGCKLGALGIPEFGTDFAMQMLIDTQPQHFSDLVRIAGLSHGTDVWLGNAQTLLQEGKATISTAICTRDDIMIYLINKGLDKELSFTIMESVRKGKGLKPEWVDIMTEAGVPDWYIWSCKKIKYMFPKAHAAAYVMMAWRIAWCKIFYPLAYYSAYFTIRANAFSYSLMCMGKTKLEEHLKAYKEGKATGWMNGEKFSNKNEDTLKDMRIVQEMYARGFEFEPIDLFKVKARSFQIINGKIMPSLTSIEGLGESAAETIEIAAANGVFRSKDDFKQKAKVGDSVANLLSNLGILGNLPESNQLSIFDVL